MKEDVGARRKPGFGTQAGYWGVVLLWMGIILYLSTRRVGVEVNPLLPYLIHFGEYAALAGVLLLALSRTTTLAALGINAVSILWSGFYGLVNELLQIYIPTRSFSVGDIAMNLLGAVSAVVLIGRRWPVRTRGLGPEPRGGPAGGSKTRDEA